MAAAPATTTSRRRRPRPHTSTRPCTRTTRDPATRRRGRGGADVEHDDLRRRVSGLDTATIINQLVALQANQQTLLKNQQTTQQSAADALGKLTTALSRRGQPGGRAGHRPRPGSAPPSARPPPSVTATASGTASGLPHLRRHRASPPPTPSSPPRPSARTGAVVAQRAGHAHRRPTAPPPTSTSAAAPWATSSPAINTAGEGIIATAVQTSPGQYRLQVTATKPGRLVVHPRRPRRLHRHERAHRRARTPPSGSARTRPRPTPSPPRRTPSRASSQGCRSPSSKLENGVTVRRPVDGTPSRAR